MALFYQKKRKPLRRKFCQITSQAFSGSFETSLEPLKGCQRLRGSGFHEIRALGSHLFDQQGVELKSVQAVMAHGDGKMTEYYQSGHGSEIQYVDAPIPALDLAGLGIKI